MKTKFKRISKSALSVILALMMVISTMLVGIVTVGAVDAVADGYYRVLFIKSNSTSSFYNVQLNYDDNNSNWTNSKATWIGQYNNNHVYYLDVPSRINSTATKIQVNDGGSNYKDMVSTAKGNIKDGYIFKIDSNGNVTCENPKEVSNFNVSSETVEIGSPVTLSASYTSVITSDVTYTYTDQDGNVLLSTTSTSDTWTPSSAGIYTITCKASDGYITKTSTTTKTVTVSAATEPTTTQPAQSKFYIIGNQFPADNSNETWTINNKKYEMTYDEANKVFTFKTTFPTGDSYFRFHNSSTLYGAPDQNDQLIEDNGKRITLSTTANNGANSFKYNGNKGSEVTIYYNPDTTQVWIESPSAQTHTIRKGTVDAAKGDFTVTVDGTSATSAAEGATITVTPTPVTTADYSYVVDKVTYTPEGGTETEVTLTDSAYTFKMPDKNVTVNVSFKKQYTITAGTCKGGKVRFNGASTVTVDADDSGSVINLSAIADTNYEFVSWVPTDGVTFATSEAITTATVSKNATITATFRSTTTPSTDYYYSYNDGSNKFVKMNVDTKYGGYVIQVNTTNGYLNADKKFKIADVDNDSDDKLNNGTHCVNYNIDINTVEKSNSLNDVYFEFNSEWHDLYIRGTSLTDFYIQYTPGGTNGLAGTIKVWSVEDYNGTVDPKTYTITKGDVDEEMGSFEVTVGGTSADSAVKDETVTVTVTPKSGYKCTGITVVKENGGEITDVTNEGNGTYTFTMPGEAVTVTPTIEKKASYTVTASSNDTTKGTVSPAGTTVTEGETVTLTAVPTSGNQFTSWNLTGSYTIADGSSLTNAEITFTPLSNVSATASFAEQTVTSCNYRIVGNSKLQFLVENWASSFEKAKAFDQYVEENVYRTTLIAGYSTGGQSDFKLINSSNTLFAASNYYDLISGGNNKKSNPYEAKSSNSQNFNFEKTGTGRYYLYVDQSESNPKIWAEKATDTVLLDEKYNIVGVFDSNGEIKVNYAAGTIKKFLVVDKDGFKYCNGKTINNAGALPLSKWNNIFDTGDFTTFNATTGGDYTIRFADNELTITSENTSSVVSVYAKDGTLRDGYEKYASMATTNIISGTLNNPSRVDYDYSLGYAKPGSTITVETTIDPDYRSKYYVKAFCVNGESYSIIDASKADKTNGVYTLSYTIPEDFVGDKIEITPIYFYFDETNTIYFYVEGFNDKVKKEWGDTISAYVYYTGGVDGLKENQNALGGYPGQPMVLEGGKYYMQVPKYLNGDTSKPVSGVTLNNYVWDERHNTGKEADKKAANCQTYDFEDFYKISQLESVDNIYFSFRYRDSVDNNPETKPSDANYSTFTNGWEYLTDYRGRYVDIFGNVLTEDQVKNASELRIISNGYVNNYIGKYATDWTIYADPTGDKSYSNKVGTITSSGTLYNTADEYETAIANSNRTTTQKETYVNTYTALLAYKNVPALITYEQSIDKGDDPGNRSDGRWYYSKKSDTVNVNTRIEYLTNEVYVEDKFVDSTAVGTSTGTKAYFTNESFSGLTKATGLVDNTKYFTFKADTDTNGNYMFVGWYLLKDGVYSPITKSAEAKAPITSSETYVARFIKTPTGSLTVTHELFSNAPDVVGTTGKPAAHGGLGTCYAKVEIVDPANSDAVIKTYNETTAAIVIDAKDIKADSKYKLKITLRTEMTGLNTYYAGYVNKSTETATGGYLKISADTDQGLINEVTITRELLISNLFTDDNGDTLTSPKVGALNYYSDIKPVTKPYKLTFNYTDRFNGDKFYVVQGNLTENYIAQSLKSYGEVTLTTAFIMEQAPYEDNFGKTIKWNDSTISRDKDGDTLTAEIGSDQTARQVVVNYRTNTTDPWADLTLDYAALIRISEEEYIEADETENNLKFSYWGIYTDSACTNLVAKCYSRKFNYIAYQDYYITPVYEKIPESVTTSDVSTTLNFLEYSRNQWTDDEGVKTSSTDRLYADFALAFNKDGLMLKDYTGTDIECGMVMEVCGKLDKATDGSYITDLSQYKYDTNETDLKTAMLAGNNSYMVGDEKRNIIMTKIANSELNNKNRIEFYQGFNNSTNNPLYVIKAYSYINFAGTITLSKPVYFNLYDVANLTYKIS